MVNLSLLHVQQAQQLLKDAGVDSVVTGDIGMNYHGVDVVTHDVELCVPEHDLKRATRALEAHKETYQRLPDFEKPDFYHPYKQGAIRFLAPDIEGGFEFQIIADTKLNLNVTDKANTESGLTRSSAHAELEWSTRNVDDSVSSSIRWPTFQIFLRGWLQCAHKAAEREDFEWEVVAMMQAERLIDAKDIDEAWLKDHFHESSLYDRAAGLLRDKPRRIAGSTWH